MVANEGDESMSESSADVATDLASDQFRERLDSWRAAHPRATMREIELAIDEQLAALRADLVTDLSQRSPLRDISSMAEDERPRCERCQTPLIARGKQRRRLRGPGDQLATLDRSYAVCPRCDLGVFPPR